MKIKFVVITLIMIVSSVGLQAQSGNLSNKEICEHIGNGLISNYHPDSIMLSKICRRGCIFIKFKINTQGKISDLAFSKDTTTLIIIALKSAMNSIQNDTALTSSLQKSGKTIIQPFIYFYQAGCSFPKINTMSATTQERLDFYYSYLTILNKMDHMDDSILNMMRFDDGQLQFLDGLILAPIQVGSGGVE